MNNFLKKGFYKAYTLSINFYKKANTFFLKLFKISNYKRWQDENSLFSSWDERTFMLSKEIHSESIVLEFGAARLTLKNYLPENCIYIPSDIVSRGEGTLVIDLNKELNHLPNNDVTVFSGVLEYVFDVKKVLQHCSKYSNKIIFSYATLDSFPIINERRFHGWVSDLSEQELEIIANTIGFKLNKIGVWKKQMLYTFVKIV